MAQISSMGITVEVKDNSPEVKKALADALHRGLVAIGMSAEDNAKKDPQMAVDTGYARNSITYAVSGYPAGTTSYKADRAKPSEAAPRTGKYVGTMDGEKDEFVAIGSNVEYFPYIEAGSRTINARHVLQRAATEHTNEYKALMKNSLENA